MTKDFVKLIDAHSKNIEKKLKRTNFFLLIFLFLLAVLALFLLIFF